MSQPLDRLTHMERTCLQMAAGGEPVDVIARQCASDLAAVEAHLAAARRKLMANTTVEAIARAIKLGLID